MDYDSGYIKKNPTLHIEDAPIKFYEIKKELFKLGKINSMLDIGCGAGVLTKLIADYLKVKKVLGIDLSHTMINKAKEFNSSSKNIDFNCIDIFKLHAKEKYDLIVCADIIEHIQNKKKFLKKLSQLGKKIVIRVPMEDSILNHLLKTLNISDELKKTEEQYGHIHHFNFDSFVQLTNSSGFKTLSQSIYLINKPRTWWFNEILRYLTKIVGLVSIPAGVKFGGGFLVVTLEKE
ncbi:hypothetical protein A3D00_04720 [Candidatus Woesebacteria bacterium RIFCSPHIGHO2_02_FULL_38_9]|uniref:Methyltransferase domain-containing protein n=1 Tax=Candidatus Woesebacteria bacterium RIFCSPHIGHO2_01_FULL_39_28 TaxID=1802496 RepID=A0A1F7YHB2_9BACT|nr:MAG: hypothetical protein A2627_04080 [Candidatus Woesebacteria bacterium RIFCSPHIGHO2_01_FULL_39_28]OGM34909.1 MAG: hypothetical protein A3D00_04720 [Candidatus Woesebacteria bacterium RIFCSPHIGHO2_02_FULL_38_9]OGM58674.1 MAG: hypothetical protein A3A50_02735 [Candidatus Woesebacteria bacterium RIFCSPLOWO2_01_FULL_38_20]